MVRPRSEKMPEGTPGTFHVVSRCTRRSFLMGDDKEHRRDWVVQELAELLGSFAIDLHAYAVMSNHVHLVLRPRPDKVASMSAERVARVGMALMPIRTGVADEKLPVTPEVISRYAAQSKWVAEYSSRLSSISWFMRLFKQHIAKAANMEDGCTGHFWESRFFCVPLLDWSAVLACMLYVDLNPWRAGLSTGLIKTTYSSLCAHADLKVSKQDAVLSQRLTSIARSHPVDPYSGNQARSSLNAVGYRSLLCKATGEKLPQAKSETAENILSKLGLDETVWSERMNEPGLFQSGAVGSHTSRASHAAIVGKKWIADKTRLWVPDD